MTKLSDYYSEEGIDHQYDRAFGLALDAEFTELRKRKITDTILKESNLTKLIKTYTGLSIKITLEEGFNGSASIPVVDINKVLLNNDIKKIYNEDEHAKLLNPDKFIISGVNLKTGMVTGDFCNQKTKIFLGDKIINSKNFTVREVVGLLLHEIGHIFTHLELLYRVTKTNYLLSEGTKRLLTANTKEQKFHILSQLEDITGVTVNDKKEISEKTNMSEVFYQTIIFDLSVRESQYQLDLNVYDIRASEQLADNYAARQGYASELASCLTKMDKIYGIMRPYLWPSFNTFLLIISYFHIFSSNTLSIMFLIKCLIVGNPFAEVYDPPRKRILKLQQQINDALKAKDLPKQQKELLIKNYKEIDNILNKMYDNLDFYTFIWKYWFSGKKSFKAIEQQERLEGLLNNNLFTAAASTELLNK